MMLKTLGIGAALGFVVGVLWLLFVAVPILVPSYLEVRADLKQARANLKAYSDSFDESEGLREAETDQCRAAVEDEANYWRTRLREISARGARFDATPSEEPENAQTPLSGHESGLCDGFEFVPAGQLHNSGGTSTATSPDGG